MNSRNYKIEGCFVDNKKKFAFIHIYKNASISIRNALNMRGKYHRWKDVKNKNLTTICVIRNPYERLISAYKYLFRLEDNGLPDQHPIHETKEMEWFKNRDFVGFVNAIEEHGFFDAVTLPQWDFINDRGLKLSDIDEVLVQSSIDEDFKKFAKKYNLNIEIPHDNVGYDEESDKLLNMILNSTKLKNKIDKLYIKDIQLYYGYVNQKYYKQLYEL